MLTHELLIPENLLIWRELSKQSISFEQSGKMFEDWKSIVQAENFNKKMFRKNFINVN